PAARCACAGGQRIGAAATGAAAYARFDEPENVHRHRDSPCAVGAEDGDTATPYAHQRSAASFSGCGLELGHHVSTLSSTMLSSLPCATFDSRSPSRTPSRFHPLRSLIDQLLLQPNRFINLRIGLRQ